MVQVKSVSRHSLFYRRMPNNNKRGTVSSVALGRLGSSILTMRLRKQHLVSAVIAVLCMGSFLMASQYVFPTARLTSNRQQEVIADLISRAPQVFGLTYGTAPFENTLNRLKQEADVSGLFQSFEICRQKDLDASFVDRFRHVLEEERGGGYWIWKVPLIQQHLKRLQYGDILVYLDGGDRVDKKGIDRFWWYVEQMQRTNTSILAFNKDQNKEFRWTSDAMFKYFNVTPNTSLWDKVAETGQYTASVLIMRKTAQLDSIMAMCNQTLYDDPYLFTDYYNKATKAKRRNFHEHRHDQSVFSIVRKLFPNDTFVIPDETVRPKTTVPFIAARLRGFNPRKISRKRLARERLERNRREGLHRNSFEPKALPFEASKNATSRSLDVISSNSNSNSFPPKATRMVRSPLIVHEHCHADSNTQARPTIVIPAVRKGLNNQRMRIVQDILVAAMIGANVELPTLLYGRVGCHYQANCYGNYTQAGTVPIWDVFDQESTLRRLHEFGICVVDSKNDTELDKLHKVPLMWPMSSSQLSHMVETGSMRLDSRIGTRWHLGGVDNCCTKILPDSATAAELLRQINYSFEPSHIVTEAVQRVEHAMPQQSHTNSNKYVAIHWRNDGDFTGNVHQLNSTAYVVAASRALLDMRTTLSIAAHMPLHVIVLGDLTSAALQDVEDAVNANANANRVVGRKSKRRKKRILLFRCYSKMSLVPDMNLAEISPSEDARGQVDFEIGVRAPAFIGTPFSSFSVLITFKRSYMDNDYANANESVGSLHQPPPSTTAMIDLDIVGNIAEIFKLQFPYDRDNGMSENPCAEMIRVFDRITIEMMGCSREASSSCPELAPAFVFKPALDDPRRIQGSVCTSVVVTTLFGTVDTLPGTTSHPDGQSCWFAFVNREAAKALGIKRRVAYDTLPYHSMWNIVILDDAQLPFGPDPSEYSRNSRAIKMLAHRGFRFARIMLYIDSQQVEILKLESMGSLADENLDSQDAAWASPYHPLRQSAYSEAQCASNDSLDPVGDKGKTMRQMAMYKAKGFPSASAEHGGPGLIGGEWHMRDLKRAESEMIVCEWFREFQYWGHPHDELSFNYVVWSLFANGTSKSAVPSDPVFVYATPNETFYTKSRQSSPKICETDTAPPALFSTVMMYRYMYRLTTVMASVALLLILLREFSRLLS
jgi:hypothetical protein